MPDPRGSNHSHTQLTINLTVTFALPAHAISVLVTIICCTPQRLPKINQCDLDFTKSQLEAVSRLE